MNLTFSLSLFPVFFISFLLLHNSLSFSSHLSIMVGIFWRGPGMGLVVAWVAQARRWWAVILADDGLLKLSEDGLGFVCCGMMEETLI